MNPVWHFLNGVPTVGPLTIGTSAVTSTVPILGPNGSAGAVTFGFSGEATTGLFLAAAGTVDLATTGTARFRWSANDMVLTSAGTINWSSGAIGAASDVRIEREAAAVIQLGADAAGTTAYTLKGNDRITSDGVGGNLTIAGGRNRGASAGGSLIFQTSPAAGAGVTGTLANRLILDSTGTALFTGNVTVFRTESSAATDGNMTYTPAQVLGGIITRTNMGSNRVDAFPTAADLVAAIPGCVVGTSFDLVINNNDTAQTVTVNGASNGITYDGTATAIAAAEARFFRVLITNVTGAAEAATVFQVV